MKKLIKIIFVILLVFCSFVFTSMCVMSSNISQEYKINRGDDFTLDTFIPITASYDGVKMSQGNFFRHVGDSFEVDLKILGIIPLSTVNVQVVDDMYVNVLGNPFGMKIYTDGVLVIESVNITTENGKENPASKAGIKVGDYIKTINGKTVTCNEDVLQLVTESGGNDMKFELVRSGKSFTCHVTPVLDKESNIYRIGIWVRDSSAGIGTLTFYSPSNNVVCGLGHGICDADTEVLLDIDKGELIRALEYDRAQYEKGYFEGKEAAEAERRWIPVTERLPKNEAAVLILAERRMYGIPELDRQTVRIVATAFHTDGKMNTEDSSYTWDLDGTNAEYDEKADSYIVPEGWWERVLYSEEFSAVDDFVPHWMPLPEPPKGD